jgi:flagellin
MGLRINTNVSSLQAQRRLNETTRAFARSLQRLSSGKRINRAGDDASGLAISEGLYAQIRGTTQAIRNINDAKGFLNTAESALGIQVDILQRMRELALQAANGAIGDRERGFLYAEFQEIFAEFQRISNTTQFNGTKLLDGSFETKQLQVGSEKGQTIDLTLEGIRVEELFTKTVMDRTHSEAATFQPTGMTSPVSTALGDLNGDGILDAVTVNRDGGALATVFVSFGNGDGTFQEGASINYGSSNADDVAIADFDNDGDLDFVIKTAGVSDRVKLYTNDGAGSFSLSGQAEGQNGWGELSTGDLNNDGNADVVISTAGGNSHRVYLGDGAGNLTEQAAVATGVGDSAIDHILIDFDNDGNLDIVGGEGQSSAIYFGNGDGTFGARVEIDADNASRVGAGDFDEDGNIDILLHDVNGDLAIHFGDGAGGITQEVEIAGTGAQGNNRDDTARVYDFDNDGHLDIFVQDEGTAQNFIRYGNGDGTFENAVEITPALQSYGLDVGDVDGDGYLDIVMSNSSLDGLRVYLANTGEASALEDIDIRTQTLAQDVLEYLDQAIDALNEERSAIGAIQNRLESAANSASILRENLDGARSGVIDADLAQETAELAKRQILQQASVSVLGQANTNMQVVLTLLGGVG